MVPDLLAALPPSADGWQVVTRGDLYRFAGVLRTDHLVERTYFRQGASGAEQVTLYLAYWPGPASAGVRLPHARRMLARRRMGREGHARRPRAPRPGWPEAARCETAVLRERGLPHSTCGSGRPLAGACGSMSETPVRFPPWSGCALFNTGSGRVPRRRSFGCRATNPGIRSRVSPSLASFSPTRAASGFTWTGKAATQSVSPRRTRWKNKRSPSRPGSPGQQTACPWRRSLPALRELWILEKARMRLMKDQVLLTEAAAQGRREPA